ncbi:MAG: caspase family protein, partial [Dehalococcoidales bacterium]|nr:caspase family protein [Dehalococcoidales bacterium]
MKKSFSRVSISLFLALVLFLVVNFALPVASARADTITECWAVFVGVAEYKYINPAVFAADDAREFRDIFSPVWGSDHIMTLTNSQGTKANILDAIDWLADNAGPEDTILFYFAGHGSDDLGGYFCPYDTSNLMSSVMLSSELADAFQPVQAEKTVIIVNTCHAGCFQSNLTKHGWIVIMGAQCDEFGWASYSLGNSVFGYYLLEALANFNTVDTNHDYELSAEEIFEYASPLTTDYVDDNYPPYQQQPVLDDRYSGWLALLAKFAFDINMALPFGTTVLTLDGTDYTSAPAPMIWIPGVSHTISVPQLVDPGSGTRYVFTQWDDGYVTVTRTITHGSYTASYDKEHL